jgi:hypothetical protein
MSAKKYGIRIGENTLDLIQVLNSGIRLELGEKESVFIFEIDLPTAIKNCEVRTEDDIYNSDGFLKEDINLIN